MISAEQKGEKSHSKTTADSALRPGFSRRQESPATASSIATAFIPPCSKGTQVYEIGN